VLLRIVFIHRMVLIGMNNPRDGFTRHAKVTHEWE
jgi:hypothetical protein